MATFSALPGLAEAWLITLIALSSIVVGSGLLLWPHQVARGAQATDRPPAAGLAAVALELDSEAAAVPKRYSVCLAQANKPCRAWPPPKRSALSSNF
jgi:hypothetical protein